ncbi:MAG: chorismate synthase, partial [Actinobacteria bacterium]|nr:chorismate synthase [Actinomycetota bacterium]
FIQALSLGMTYRYCVHCDWGTRIPRWCIHQIGEFLWYALMRVRIAMKPISTVPKALDTIDVATKEPAKAINQRSDVCAVPAAGIVAEAMVALVLAEAVMEKFGGDSAGETKRNIDSYLANLPKFQ